MGSLGAVRTVTTTVVLQMLNGRGAARLRATSGFGVAVMLAVVGYAGGMTVMQILADPPYLPLLPLPEPALAVDAGVPAVSSTVSGLLRLDDDLIVAVEHRDAPPTPLNLRLKGIMFTEVPADSRAIISSGEDGDDVSYGLGSAIPGGAVLDSLYSDRVVIERRGQFETLFFDLDAAPDDANRERRVVRRNATDRIDRRNDKALAGRLSELRSLFLNQPQRLSKHAVVVPETGRDRPGFRIDAGPDGGRLLRSIGILPGDVVTAVNGRALTGTVKGVEAMQVLASATEIELDVLRNNEDLVLQYRFAN